MPRAPFPWHLHNPASLCPTSRATCPWVLLRLMQSLSRLQSNVPLPSWLHPLPLPLTERRAVCQAMEDRSGLPQETRLPGSRLEGSRAGLLHSPTARVVPERLRLPLHPLPGTPVAGAKIKLCAHARPSESAEVRALCLGDQADSRLWSSYTLLYSCPRLGSTAAPQPHSHPGPSSLKLSQSKGQVR